MLLGLQSFRRAVVTRGRLALPGSAPLHTMWMPRSCSWKTLLPNSVAGRGGPLGVTVFILCVRPGLFPLSFPAAGSGRHVDAAKAVAGGAGGYRPGGEEGVQEAGVAAYQDPG